MNDAGIILAVMAGVLAIIVIVLLFGAAKIREKLAAAGIPIASMRQQVSFDTQEACDNQHDGKWHLRFS